MTRFLRCTDSARTRIVESRDTDCDRDRDPVRNAGVHENNVSYSLMPCLHDLQVCRREKEVSISAKLTW